MKARTGFTLLLIFIFPELFILQFLYLYNLLSHISQYQVSRCTLQTKVLLTLLWTSSTATTHEVDNFQRMEKIVCRTWHYLFVDDFQDNLFAVGETLNNICIDHFTIVGVEKGGITALSSQKTTARQTKMIFCWKILRPPSKMHHDLFPEKLTCN